MGLAPSFSVAAVDSVFDDPLYDVNAARELFLLVGAPNDAGIIADHLAHPLSESAKWFALGLWNEVQGSTPQREKQARRLVLACEKVLEIVGVDNEGELLPMFGPGGLFAAAQMRRRVDGEAATMESLDAVKALRQDALILLEIESVRRRMKRPKAGHPSQASMRKLVRDLSQIYESGWGRTPGISNSGNEPSGPLMRLMIDVTSRLRARGLRFNASPASLRQHWRRLADPEKCR